MSPRQVIGFLVGFLLLFVLVPGGAGNAGSAAAAPAATKPGAGVTSAASHRASSGDEEEEEDGEDEEDEDDDRRAANLPINGWWWAPSQPGRGYSIEIRRNHAFIGAYTYDSQGQATWLISSGAMRTATSYRGQFTYHRNGPTLSSGSSGQGSGVAASGSAGRLEITFTSPTTASLAWAGETVEIERFSIVTDGAATNWDTTGNGRPTTGWYWDRSRAGSGFFTEMQGETLFLVAFFYRSDGSPAWYVAMQGLLPGTSGETSLFTGALYEYASSGGGGEGGGGGGEGSGCEEDPTAEGCENTEEIAAVDVVTPGEETTLSGYTELGTITVQFLRGHRARVTMPAGDEISLRRFRF
jgi:hypothetical protein